MEDIKLTKLSKCAGCGAKVGAGVLSQLLEDIRVHHDPNLIVGFDKSDDASVYRVSDELAVVQTKAAGCAHRRIGAGEKHGGSSPKDVTFLFLIV